MADTYCHHGMTNQTVHAFNGKIYVNLCCEASYPDKAVEIKNVKDILLIRDALNKGIRHSHCSQCWDKEKNGIVSLRQILNRDPQPNYYTYQLFFDNTCDLACIYCNAGFSSKWEQEVATASDNDKKILLTVSSANVNNGKKEPIDFSLLLDSITDLSANPDLKSCTIQLLGGETLLTPMIKKNLITEIVDRFYLPSSQDKKLLLSIVTNGNTPKNILANTIESIKELKTKYDNLEVQISISMESTKLVAEYIRYGLDWEVFNENLDAWINCKEVRLHINLTINIVSLLDTGNFVRYVLDKMDTSNRKTIKFRFTFVDSPDFLAINILPNSYSYVFDDLENIVKNSSIIEQSSVLLKVLNDNKGRLNSVTDDKLLSKLKTQAIEYFAYIKRVRGLDINNVNPTLLSTLIQ